MKNSFLRILEIIVGILITVFGGWLLFQPIVTMVSITSFYISILMVTGILAIFSYFANLNKTKFNSVTKLILGLIDVLVACLLFTNFELVSLSLPLILSIWVMIRGVVLLIFAIDLRKFIGSGWGILAISSVLLIVLGYIGFVNPMVSTLGVGFIGGMQVMMMGINMVLDSFYSVEI